MQCRSCQHDNRGNARFCAACGVVMPIRCAQCDGEIAPGMPFCDLCGAAQATDRVDPAPGQRPYTPAHLAVSSLNSRFALEGERKQVTVLFCDITNSVELARHLGADEMHELLNQFFELALAEVHLLEGTVNQFLGDGFMALFGAPLAHEDHVRRALLAALAIRQRLAEVAAQGDSALGSIAVRMGANTGTVVVGKIGDKLRMDYTAVGDTTNIAARLQAVAAPGQICVSQVILEAGRSHFDFAPLGSHTLKGIEEAVPVHALIRARARNRDDVAARASGIGSPLVGREQELGTICAQLERLAMGHGGILVLSGEPGAGKSRLSAESARHPCVAKLRWLEGRAVSFGRSVSYLPFIEVVKECFAIDDDDTEATAFGKLERGLAKLLGERAAEMLPYLATVLALRLPAEFEARVRFLDSQALGRQVFLCMRQLFEQLAMRQPLVLHLEDWHWADQSSIELAEHLLPLTATTPLLVFISSRADPDHAVQRVRQHAAAHPGGELCEIRLAPMTVEHSRQLVANLIGAIGLPEAMHDEILRKTDGNPFFIEEVIRTLLTQGVLVRDPDDHSLTLAQEVESLDIPDTVQGLILSRIDRLSDEVKQTLKLASVIGRSFFGRVLQMVNRSSQAQDASMSELEAVELIRRRQAVPEIEYIFKHALVQEATYGSILVDQRRAIHRRVAQAIETLFEHRLEEFTSVLAYHYSHAEDWEKAQDYLFKAGDQAGRMAADTEALDHFRQAESAYLKAFGGRLKPLQRSALARKIASALYGTGHYPQALAQFRRALATLGLHYPSGPWGVRRAILTHLAQHVARRIGRRLGWTHGRAIDLASAEELSGICHAMSWMDYFIDKERMLLDCLMQLHIGENSQDLVAEAQGLSSLGFGFMTFNLRGLSRRYHLRAAELASRSQHPAAIAFAAHALGFLDFYDGHWDEADAHFVRAASTYRDSGDIHRAGGAILMRALVIHKRGDIALLDALADESIHAGENAADPQLASWGTLIRSYAAMERGPIAPTAALLRASAEMAARIPAWDLWGYLQAVLGKCLVQMGQVDEALAVCSQALRVLDAENFRLAFDQIEVCCALATCHLARLEHQDGGDKRALLADAGRACDKALKLARQQPAWLPQALRLKGTLAWLAGRQAQARTHWQQSLALAERSRFPIEHASTRLEIGRRTGDIALVEQAASALRKAGAHVPLALAMTVSAQIQAGGGDLAQALHQYESALTALQAIDAPGELARARSGYTSLLAKTGRQGRLTTPAENLLAA